MQEAHKLSVKGLFDIMDESGDGTISGRELAEGACHQGISGTAQWALQRTVPAYIYILMALCLQDWNNLPSPRHSKAFHLQDLQNILGFVLGAGGCSAIIPCAGGWEGAVVLLLFHVLTDRDSES